jgi:hypothetical protein
MVSIPVRILTEGSIAIGLEVWSWVIDARPDLESRVMIEITEAWHYTIQLRRGLFSSAHKYFDHHLLLILQRSTDETVDFLQLVERILSIKKQSSLLPIKME